MLTFEVVGTLGRARSRAGKRLLSSSPYWGNGHHPSSAGQQLGVSALHPVNTESISLHFQRWRRPAGPGLMLSFPSPLQLRPLTVLVPPRVCCLVGEGGEESKHGLCLGALPARIAAGAGGLGLCEHQCN